MKLIIIGNGQVGSALATAFADHDLLHWKNDISDLDSVTIESVAPSAIINAAGKTDLKWCEEHAREAFRSNVEAPVELYQQICALSKKTGQQIRFLHFSSGCIWDGPYDEEGKPFTPNHPARPAAYYSWTKAACDLFLLSENPSNVAILRPRQVYSSSTSARNTLSKLLRYPKLIDTPNSMSNMDSIIATVRHCLSETDWSGIWNIYDPGITSPFKIGELLAEAGLREKPAKITKDELDGFHKPKRVDTVLYDSRFEERIKPDSLEKALQKTIAEFKQKLTKDPI